MEKLEEGGENCQADMLPNDRSFLREAIRLAEEAEQSGNLPIGALIVLHGEVVAWGKNAIWQPALNLTRHAEMEALRNLPSNLRASCGEMTLYTTLEPCLMCAGAILLHQLSRVVFGSSDLYGGVGSCIGSLPPYFKDVYLHMQWIGPALPAECDPLYARVMEYEQRH
jgi:tRNA(adenine34) deaminase